MTSAVSGDILNFVAAAEHRVLTAAMCNKRFKLKRFEKSRKKLLTKQKACDKISELLLRKTTAQSLHGKAQNLDK